MVHRRPRTVPRPAAPTVVGSLGVMRALPPVLTHVERELSGWMQQARRIPDPELRHQALASLARKRFHCAGGAVYALAAGPALGPAVRFIVALQTISDYLDNLCDRSPAAGGPDFRQMHLALRDAVLPGPAPLADYYRLHPHREDGGYLASLVTVCRREVSALAPGAAQAFSSQAAILIERYSALQEYKHLPAGREDAVRRWASALADGEAGLAWWEAAAAAGSTLGVFALYAAAASHRLDTPAAQRLVTAYFPWVTALHILLDYWIDRDEDRRGGDMNFTRYYAGAGAAARRLQAIARLARRRVADLPDAWFHRVVVAGLPALYLSDPKAAQPALRRHAVRLLGSAGPATWLLYATARCLRAQGALEGAPP
jgi:tetraprenyl-beta-curcumene synthase